MRIGFLLLALILVGGMAYIRLAPSDPTQWHQAIGAVGELAGGPVNTVHQLTGGAVARVVLDGVPAPQILARLDAIARETPRTIRLAGSPEDGRITWVTRSAMFGFPDYTTAEIVTDGPEGAVDLFARQRFGAADFGVNSARLRDWLARLAA
jgi:hypothetical protein